MATQAESPAPAAVSGASGKLLQLLRKRLRQLARVMIVLAVVLAVAAAALAVWWLTSLNGLPDIGDPFDVTAFRAFSVPDDRNAFTYFRRAKAMLTPVPKVPPAQHDRSSVIPWSDINPRLRAWVEANHAAVDLFRQGADQSDGISRPAGEGYSERYTSAEPGWLIWLVLSEGGRLEESGHMAGAWGCYRAVLRMTAHVRRRGSLFDRAVANTHHDLLRKRLATWAVDPRTTIPQLRRALGEAIDGRPRSERDGFSLKIEYLDLMQFLERPDDRTFEPLEGDLTYRLGDLQLPVDLVSQAYGFRRFLLREPERSRRAIRLLFANWLAHVEVPDPQGSKPAVHASFHVPRRTITLGLYPVSREAPAGARVLSPREVASWLVTTHDAWLPLGEGLWPSVRFAEQRGYRELTVLLARELYHRERGGVPPSEDALVGTYLESLPDDASGELDDGTTPTVSNGDNSVQTPPR